MKNSILLIVVAITCLSSVGCGRPAQKGEVHALKPWVGESVVVQFRRDALGAAAALPINPRTSSINGAETMIVGTLVEVNPLSVTIETSGDGELKWVPREVILLIEKRS